MSAGIKEDRVVEVFELIPFFLIMLESYNQLNLLVSPEESHEDDNGLLNDAFIDESDDEISNISCDSQDCHDILFLGEFSDEEDE
jgi:hypothetical protein